MSINTTVSRAPEKPVPSVETVDLKLEAVVIPVSDVDRAKAFYDRLGWKLDGDFKGDSWRAIQFTPPGSPCSVQFGQGITTNAPGSAQGLLLVVNDIDAARASLVARGVDVSEVFHYAGIRGAVLPGPAPQHGSYGSYATFRDPDGNGWVLQEVTTRLPGRGLSNDVATLTDLLREAEEHHGKYEATAPKHHWSQWYAAFIEAREQGRTAEEAEGDAAMHMERLRARAQA